MSDGSSPDISVILVTLDHYGRIHKTIKYIRSQTVRDRLEIVIVAPSLDKLGLDVSELKDFLQFQVVEVGEIISTGETIAAGFRKACAPVGTYVEEHAYPEPGWA